MSISMFVCVYRSIGVCIGIGIYVHMSTVRTIYIYNIYVYIYTYMYIRTFPEFLHPVALQNCSRLLMS